MKKFMKCLIITVVLWGISRFIPGIICSLDPSAVVLRMVLFVLLLPLGWLASNAISQGQHPDCIRINLFIFAFLEMIGLFSIFSMIMNLSYYTGRYSTDANGIPYSQYPIRIIGALCFIAIYVGLCFLLCKKTNAEAQTQSQLKQENHTVPDHIPELKNFWYENGCIFAEFQSGRIMKYIGVPDKNYRDMCDAPKKSKYLFGYIIGIYEAEEVKKSDSNKPLQVQSHDVAEKESFEDLPENINESQVSPFPKDDKVDKSYDDKFDDIKKYKELLDLDIITQEEFNAKKKELLDL